MRYVQLPVLIILSIFTFLATSCNQVSSDDKVKSTAIKRCYVAIYEKDTAFLKLIFTGSEIDGKMNMKYADGKIYNGVLKGKSKGDTLLMAYDLKINNLGKWYRNPVAFLKKTDTLVLGESKINVAWGTGVFDKNVPIKYDNSKFMFIKVDCNETLKEGFENKK